MTLSLGHSIPGFLESNFTSTPTEGSAKVPDARRQENFDRSVLSGTRGSKFSDNAVDGTFAEPSTTSQPTMKQATIKITGKVQGVFYRAHAQEKAESLGLTGYAQNMRDGSVEAVVQGEEADIQSLIDWAKQGSPSSKVENVEVKWNLPKEIYKDFSTY